MNYGGSFTTGLNPRFDLGTFGTRPASNNDLASESFDVFTQLVDGSYSDTDFLIQALPDTNLENTVVPVGLMAASGSAVSFTVNTENLPVGYMVYLEDRKESSFTRLDGSFSYDFIADSNLNGTGRFFLHTTTQTLNNNIDAELTGVTIYQRDVTTLEISGLVSGNTTINLVNLLGQQVITESFEAESLLEASLVPNVPKSKRGLRPVVKLPP